MDTSRWNVNICMKDLLMLPDERPQDSRRGGGAGEFCREKKCASCFLLQHFLIWVGMGGGEVAISRKKSTVSWQPHLIEETKYEVWRTKIPSHEKEEQIWMSDFILLKVPVESWYKMVAQVNFVWISSKSRL